ncbi:hypothetical protein BHE74_00026333, partial [Ensete ventricosum]
AEGIPPKLNRRSRSSARGCESTLILGSLPLHLPLAIVGSGEASEGVPSFPSPSLPPQIDSRGFALHPWTHVSPFPSGRIRLIRSVFLSFSREIARYGLDRILFWGL